MTTKKQFINPWYVVDLRNTNTEIHRATLRLPSYIVAYFDAVHGPGGEPTLQTTINLLLKELYDEFQRRGIASTYNPKQYESVVVECCDRIAVAAHNADGCTAAVPQPSGQAVNRNDQRGVASVAQPAPERDIQSRDTVGRSTGTDDSAKSKVRRGKTRGGATSE